VAPPVEFDIPAQNQSESGLIKLIWKIPDHPEPPEGIEFELQRSKDTTFGEVRVLYRGPDLASYLSGLKNGKYYFRVRSLAKNGTVEGPWSDFTTVTVEHHSLQLALTLAGLGGFVFLMTVGVVIVGVRRTEREGKRTA
jgi:hypothetical protein